MQRATGAPLDLSPDGPQPPSLLERWKLPLTAVLLVAAAIGAAWWLTRRPVEQPIVIPTPGGESTRQVRIHVTGAVASPGTYTLARGSRVEDALREAGGAAAGADLSRVNPAMQLRDGQQVVVPLLAQPTPAAAPAAPASSAASAKPAPRAKPAAPSPDAPLNLNRATAAELETLPGVGEVTANRILEHRDRNGAFQAPDDLLRARLVNARTWDQIKELVEAP